MGRFLFSLMIVFVLASNCFSQSQEHVPTATNAEYMGGEKPVEGLVETTLSKNFNYGLFFLPFTLGSGNKPKVALDTQFYWDEEGGSKLLIGGAYLTRVGWMNLFPGIYGVSESCHRGTTPSGCWDFGLGLNWEGEKGRFVTRGFLFQTTRNPELRFGYADPIQLYLRFGDGKWQTGAYAVGDETREEAGRGEHETLGKVKYHLNPGWGLRRVWEHQGVYVEGAPLFHPAGFRFSIGKNFRHFTFR